MFLAINNSVKTYQPNFSSNVTGTRISQKRITNLAKEGNSILQISEILNKPPRWVSKRLNYANSRTSIMLRNLNKQKEEPKVEKKVSIDDLIKKLSLNKDDLIKSVLI